jgi:ectoine hydroxylase-related dioxygenase (phytanoyl-CoA dioxygenase family)
VANLSRDGYTFTDLVLTDTQCEWLALELPEADGPGVRNLHEHPAVLRLVHHSRFVREVGPFTPVKATLFDKTPQANWRVQWHQDRSPATLAARIHLDDCGPDDGALRVIPGSHRRGVIPESELAAIVAHGPVVELHAPRGAILLMHPLLVHSSARATQATQRRVLHIELG